MQEMLETQIRFLSWEDTLEEEMETHSSMLAWEIPGTEKPGGLQSIGSQSQTWLSTHLHRSRHSRTCYQDEVSWIHISVSLLLTQRKPCSTTFHVTALHRRGIFYELKVCGNPESRKSFGTIFFFSQKYLLTLWARCDSVSHFGNSCNISNFFVILICVMVTMTSDLWCYHYNSLKAHVIVSVS